MPFRPLTIVAVSSDDVAASGVTKKLLAAIANAKVPVLTYWCCVAALWCCLSFCVWGLTFGRLVRFVDTPNQALTTIGRVFITIVLFAGTPLAVAVIARITRRHVFAARRELGEPICGRCGYPLQPDRPRCPECGEANGPGV